MRLPEEPQGLHGSDPQGGGGHAPPQAPPQGEPQPPEPQLEPQPEPQPPELLQLRFHQWDAAALGAVPAILASLVSLAAVSVVARGVPEAAPEADGSAVTGAGSSARERTGWPLLRALAVQPEASSRRTTHRVDDFILKSNSTWQAWRAGWWCPELGAQLQQQ